MLSVCGFTKRYGGTVAVENLSFEVEAGQILGLVGPNGAGKTTTLRALAGVISASGGTLRVCGYDVEREPIHAKRCLALVPDDPQLFSDLTVQQHLAFMAAAYRVPRAEQLASELLERFELVEKQRARAADLSRGMRQKLAICCAYLTQPSVVLFDEPLTGLDPHGIRTLKRSMVQRAEQGGVIVVSSHLLAMVEDICTHVLLLDRGENRFWGPLAELKHQYAQDGASLEEVFFRATARSEAAELSGAAAG